MNLMVKAVLPALVLALLGAAGAYTALADGVRPITGELRAAEQVTHTEDERLSEYSREFLDDSGNRQANAAIEVRKQGEGLYETRVSVWHRRDTKLDSFHLRLDLDDPRTPSVLAPDVALLTPGGNPWPPMTYRQTRDGRSVVVDIPDTGFQGNGTFTLEFLMGSRVHAVSLPEEIGAHVEFGLRGDGVPRLSRSEGEAAFQARLPGHSGE